MYAPVTNRCHTDWCHTDLIAFCDCLLSAKYVKVTDRIMDTKTPTDELVGRGNREGAQLFREWFADLSQVG